MAKNEKIKKRKKFKPFDIAVIIGAIFVCVITLYPMYYVAICSVSSSVAVNAGMVTWKPVGFNLKAYELIFRKGEYWGSFAVTIFYCAVTTIIQLITTILMAYPLSRPDLNGRKFVTWFLLVPMYFSGGMIPSYLLICKLGLYNTVWSVILPCGVGIWNIILCKTYMQTLPDELIESAQMDGASHALILRKIIVPLSKPVLAVISMYIIVGIWNEWFRAALYMPTSKYKPLQLYLKNILLASSANLSESMLLDLPSEARERFIEVAKAADLLKHAFVLITAIPIVCVYPMFQKHFTKGIMLGSLKG